MKKHCSFAPLVDINRVKIPSACNAFVVHVCSLHVYATISMSQTCTAKFTILQVQLHMYKYLLDRPLQNFIKLA
jgi:hypothetical protein